MKFNFYGEKKYNNYKYLYDYFHKICKLHRKQMEVMQMNFKFESLFYSFKFQYDFFSRSSVVITVELKTNLFNLILFLIIGLHIFRYQYDFVFTHQYQLIINFKYIYVHAQKCSSTHLKVNIILKYLFLLLLRYFFSPLFLLF